MDGPTEIQFTRYTKEDFENIKSLGCDVVRLPINLHGMTGGAPDYKLRFRDESHEYLGSLRMVKY